MTPPFEVLKTQRRSPYHRVPVRIGGKVEHAMLLKSIDESNSANRNTLVFTRPHEILPLLPRAISQLWSAFSAHVEESQKQWDYHPVATLKRIVSEHRKSKSFTNFPLLTVTHRFGAVPALKVAFVDGFNVALLNDKLPEPFARPSTDAEHLEELLLLKEFLPHLLTAYYEQIAYYFRAIFFSANAKQVVSFPHRIREILGQSIGTKLALIEACKPSFKKSKVLADTIAHLYEKEIIIAHAVSHYAHLCINYILSFFGIKHRGIDYYSRLSSIKYNEGLFGEEIVPQLKAFSELIVNPPANGEIPQVLSLYDTDRTEWLEIFRETAMLLSEANLATRDLKLDSPLIFLSHHHGVDDSEKFADFLEMECQRRRVKVRIMRGRDVNSDIRWSLLSRIWICDYHLFFIPHSWKMIGHGELKEIKNTKNWFFLELFYAHALHLESRIIVSSPKNEKLLRDFAEKIEKYTNQHELHQIPSDEWTGFIAQAKQHLVKHLHVSKLIPYNPSAPNDFWDEFYALVCQPSFRKLVSSMFRSWAYSFSHERWSIVQRLLQLGHDGKRLTVNEVHEILTESGGLQKSHITVDSVRDHLNDLSEFEFIFSGGAFAPFQKRKIAGKSTYQLRAHELYLFLEKKWDLVPSLVEYGRLRDELLCRG